MREPSTEDIAALKVALAKLEQELAELKKPKAEKK
jgi:hypothetical protein